jgi:hypothetical protein
MIGTLLFDKTPPDVRLDRPIETVVHIPLNHVRAVVRLLSLLVMVGASIYAIVTVSLHFNDPKFIAPLHSLDKSLDEALDATFIALRILQLMSAAGTLAFGVFGAMRAIALLQSRESGLSIGPRGVTIACDLRHPGGRLVLWRSIASIEPIASRGSPTITMRLNSPDEMTRRNNFFSRWFGPRVTIPVRSLHVRAVDLKILLDRYFAHYATPHSPSSKEPS